MTIAIDIVGKPSYQCPQPNSQAYKMISKEPLMTPSAFHNCCSTYTSLSPQCIMVCGHIWGSLADAEYHVWVKPPVLIICALMLRQEKIMHLVWVLHSCTCFLSVLTLELCKHSHDNVDQEKVGTMLLRDLGEVKQSVVSLCKTVTHNDKHSPCDLTPLNSHPTKLSVSLQSFDTDIMIGMKTTSYLRYKKWLQGLSEGLLVEEQL